MSINKVFISGNMSREPELRKAASGLPVLLLGMAVNDRRRNPQTDEWEDHANWVDCVMFGTRAEKVAPLLAKGSKLAIEGKLRWSQWEKDGQKRSKIEVVVDEIELLSRSGRQEGGTYQGNMGSGPQNGSQGVYDSDIPF